MSLDYPIVLVGGPDSGKTNYLARLWEALLSQKCALVSPDMPPELKYVEEALAHLFLGRFAPRSNKDFEAVPKSFEIPVVSRSNRTALATQIVVPDVTGELWKTAVETCELPPEWMDTLDEAAGALVFVRMGSDQNVAPLDWVTAAAFLRMPGMEEEVDPPGERRIPTQVALCELLRFLEYSLVSRNAQSRPRVAIVITAWDRLDADRANLGPSAYIAAEYPLLAGRLADIDTLDVKVFGMSVVSGDFLDEGFREEFFEKEFSFSGYSVQEINGVVQTMNDVTLPVAWVVTGEETHE